jgi:ABC-type transporter Mla subunit MlaD
MSEDRILRLENAMATLAEISAQHDERLAAIERSNQRLEHTVHKLEQGFQGLEQSLQTLTELAAGQQERVSAVERTTQTLAELAADHHQLIANLQRRATGLEESQVMLVEMLRTHHDGITEMRAAQANSDAKIAALAESQAHSDRKLDVLIDIVRTRFNDRSESS